MHTVTRVLADIAMSVYKYVRTKSYLVGVTPGTLLTHFTQLSIVPAYPDDLTKLLTPTLAVGNAAGISTEALYYGEQAQDQVLPLELFGFVHKQGSEVSNRLYRDRLANDVFWLFDALGRHEGIPLFDQATATEIGQVEVIAARLRMLPSTVPSVEVDRFKFLIELELGYTAVDP